MDCPFCESKDIEILIKLDSYYQAQVDNNNYIHCGELIDENFNKYVTSCCERTVSEEQALKLIKGIK